MFSPALGQTIAVVDRTGKVVSTSRHLLNVFKEAKSAYLERKAEIAAARQAQDRDFRRPRPTRAYTIDDVRSATPSHRSRRSRRSIKEHRGPPQRSDDKPALHRRHSDGFHEAEDSPRDRGLKSPYAADRSLPLRSPLPGPPGTPLTPLPPYTPHSAIEPGRLARRATAYASPSGEVGPPALPKRPKSSDGIDMNLAYGEAPPNLMLTKNHNEAEMRGLVGRVKGLLEEAHCLHHSATTTMSSLQKNPEAMAAVALTLAEISSLAKRMAPGALLKVRALAPAVFALLSSPQFLIAAGVGVGVTVIAFGGYKVIKKIAAGREEGEPGMDQMIALSSEISAIENWRQGIADVEARSVGTSVDGEFITPVAAGLSRLNLAEERARGVDGGYARELKGSEGAKSARSVHSRSSRDTRDTREGGGKERREGGEGKDRRERKEGKPKVKPKPSPLRSLFKAL